MSQSLGACWVAQVGFSFSDKISSRIKKAKSLNDVVVFSISTTAKKEKEPYLTPLRDCGGFILTGCVIFNQAILPALLKKIDGVADIILVDSEKKIPLSINPFDREEYALEQEKGLDSIANICSKYVVKSQIVEFKPNDLTVDAAWLFLSYKFGLLRDKKVSILGAGNIGSKLALKLVECDAQVHLHRRDCKKGKVITNGLNLVKPESVNADIQFHQSAKDASLLSDVVIGASSGLPVINSSVIDNVKHSCLVVDLGKNNLTKNAIKIASERSLEIYRVDVASAIESYVVSVLKMQDTIRNSYGKKDLGFCNIVGGGFYGSEGDIVVDRIESPQYIVGVCRGNGALKAEPSWRDLANIDRLKKENNIED